MKLTPFGFTSRAETFVKDALSLPPRGGGQWSTQRLVNFMDHTGSLQILLDPGTGVVKPSAILRSRITGGPRDSGIQGWVEYPPTDTREAFVLRETDAERAMEEIFDIVEKVLAKIPEWDNSGMLQRPEPPPRVFEPLIPAIQKTTAEPIPEEVSGGPADPVVAPEASETVANFPDAQSFVDSLLSPDSFDSPPSEPTEPVPAEPEAEIPAEPEATVEPSIEEAEKPAKKPGRGRKPKA
jgi:hypothetical protein